MIIMTGNLPIVRNSFCHRTDYLHRKALASVAFVEFTCVLEIRRAEKFVLFLKKLIVYKYLALV